MGSESSLDTPQLAKDRDAQDGIRYGRLLLFFLPLAASPLLIASSHSIVNAALARLPAPEVSIAILSVVKAFSNTLKAPGLLATQVVVSLADGSASYRLVHRFIWGLSVLLFFVLATLAFTRAGEWFLRSIMGIHDQQSIAFAYTAMRITCFLPFVETLRNSYHGLAILARRTMLVSSGTVLRVIVISLFCYWAVRSQLLPGITVGALTWTIGIGIEGIFLLGCILWRYGSAGAVVAELPQNRAPLSFRGILQFFLPLAFMMFVMAALQPVIQAAIARAPIEPTQALAAYGVAWSLVLIINGPLRMLHQCSLVYTRAGSQRCCEQVQLFCLGVGLVVTLLLLAVSLTPIGYVIFRQGIGVSHDVAALAHTVLLSFSGVPLLQAWQEFHWGVLMQRRDTKVIGAAKTTNLVVACLVLAVLVLSGWFMIHPAVAGGLAFTAGQAVESVTLWRYSLRSRRQIANAAVG